MVDKEVIYIVVDNAGSNGINEAVLEYSEYLAANYKIVVHRQVPRSPKLSILDLGTWMTVQSRVEIYCRRNFKQQDALAWYVKKSWRNVEEQKLTKVWERFLMVLDPIIHYQGRKDLVESNQGLKGAPEENVENDSFCMSLMSSNKNKRFIKKTSV